MTSPGADQPVSFARDIKVLFRPMDRESMAFAFDLWEVRDVRMNADAIFDRLRDGTMPCDRAWSPEDVELFGRWIASGKLE